MSAVFALRGLSCAHHVTWSPNKLWRSTSILFSLWERGNLYYVWLSLLRAFLFAYGGMRAAAAIHGKLLRAVLRARMSFFDNTPLGRILNR
jgi:ABC-type bacteriocin/lantibiotic exporter with double-glycine peptidase domain